MFLIYTFWFFGGQSTQMEILLEKVSSEQCATVEIIVSMNILENISENPCWCSWWLVMIFGIFITIINSRKLELRVWGSISVLTENVLYRNALAVWSFMLASLIVKTKTCVGQTLFQKIKKFICGYWFSISLTVFKRVFNI